MRLTTRFMVILPLALAAQSVTATGPTYAVDIPAQPLAKALDELSRQTGLQPFYADGALSGKQSSGLKGRFSKREALDKLLGPSGLAYTLTGANTVAVKAQDKGDTETLSAVTVVGEAAYDSTDPFNKNYETPVSSITTKTNTPIFDSPFSVQVVPREVINDQRSATLEDALENVSGVRSNSNEQEGYSYVVRGFQVLNLFRNSLLASIAVPTVFETANLESVQVLKGPSSILFGRVDPGGTINMVTKRPLDSPYNSLAQEFGSYGYFRTVWDSTAPVTADGSLAYRLSGSYESSDTFRDFQAIDRFFISPSLLWKISDDTEIKFDVQYLNNNSQSDTGFPALGNRPADIPISRSFQEPNDPDDESYHVLGSYELTHRFNEDWTFHNRFHAIQANLMKLNVAPMGLEEDGTLHRAVQYQQLDGEAYATNFDVTGKFDLFGSRHDVLVGFDLFSDGSN